MNKLRDLYQLLTALIEGFKGHTPEAQIGVLKFIQAEMKKMIDEQEDDLK